MFQGDVKYGRKRFQKSGPCLSKSVVSAAAAVPASLSNHTITSSGVVFTQQQASEFIYKNYLMISYVYPAEGSNFMVDFQIHDEGVTKQYELKVTGYTDNEDEAITNLAVANVHPVTYVERDDLFRLAFSTDAAFHHETPLVIDEMKYIGFSVRRNTAFYIFQKTVDNSLCCIEKNLATFQYDVVGPILKKNVSVSEVQKDKALLNEVLVKAQQHPSSGLVFRMNKVLVDSYRQENFFRELSEVPMKPVSNIQPYPKDSIVVTFHRGDNLFSFNFLTLTTLKEKNLFNLATKLKFSELLNADTDNVSCYGLENFNQETIFELLDDHFKTNPSEDLQYIGHMDDAGGDGCACYFSDGRMARCIGLKDNEVRVFKSDEEVLKPILELLGVQ